MSPSAALVAIPLSFASAIILGYFVGLDKRSEKKNSELHLIGLGGAIFIGIFYYSINKFLYHSIITKIVYLSFVIVTSVYLTKNHLDEMNKAED